MSQCVSRSQINMGCSHNLQGKDSLSLPMCSNEATERGEILYHLYHLYDFIVYFFRLSERGELGIPKNPEEAAKLRNFGAQIVANSFWMYEIAWEILGNSWEN